MLEARPCGEPGSRPATGEPLRLTRATDDLDPLQPNRALGADHVAKALTTLDSHRGLWVEGAYIYERAFRACDLVAVLKCHHRIDWVGARSLELESGSYRWVVGVDHGVEIWPQGTLTTLE